MTLEPVSVQQFKVGGVQANPKDIGNFIFQVSGYGTTAESTFKITELISATQPRPTVYQAVHNVVTEFTVDFMLGGNPIILVVCSNQADPDPNKDFVFILCPTYDLTTANAVANPPAINISYKFNGGSNHFGPYKIPGDYKYFRMYQHFCNLPAGTILNGNLVTLRDILSPDPNPNTQRVVSYLTVYGY